MGLKKKGFFFTLDAFFAAALLVTGMILLSKFTFQEVNTEQIDLLSKDVLVAFSELKVGYINNSWIKNEINTSGITDVNNSVLEQIGEYWATGESAKAEYLAQLMSANLIPSKYGFSLVADGTTIYTRSIPKTRDLVSAQRMISGIAEGSPIEGSSSSAYLRKIRSKTFSSYAYFGGFVGQGNITIFIDDLPTDISENSITDIILELDTDSSFYFEINNFVCNYSNITTYFTSLAQNMSPDVWNITHCKNLITSGKNYFEINFLGGLNESYVAGGYIKIDYKTNQTITNDTFDSDKYYFPEINGIINLFDSFYVPGTLNQMGIYLNYFINRSNATNATVYFSIGNDLIYTDSNTTNVSTFLSNAYLSTKLNYSEIDLTTVPLRVGLSNMSGQVILTSGEPADTILVTDVSGSMDWCGLYNEPLTCSYYCAFSGMTSCAVTDVGSCSGDACGRGCFFSLFHSLDCVASRIELAREADNLSVSIILNSTGTRVGLVSYDDSVVGSRSLTSNSGLLYSDINSYGSGGGTCICCGIYKAFDMLQADETSDYMIVLSDGDANYKCSGPGDYTGTSDAGQAPASTIAAGQYACNNAINNVTVFTIGFGSDISSSGTQTLMDTACNNSFYFNATNASTLAEIYFNISRLIVKESNYSSQILLFEGNISDSFFSGDSYIEFNYTPLVDDPNPNELSIIFQTDQFNSCNKTVYIPAGLRLVEAKMTSYSSQYWTDFLTVNDESVFDLSGFYSDYAVLGDPFIIEIPVTSLIVGADNNLSIRTGSSPLNSTACSDNNSFIYKAMVNYSSSRTAVASLIEGCKWVLEFEDGTFLNISVPESYSGSNNCSFTNSTIEYNSDDAYDSAVYAIFKSLDFDKDGRILFNLVSEDLEIVVNIVSGIPYLWGPAIIEARVWQ